MGREEGSVSYPRSSSSSSAVADDNKCYTEWDFCNAGSEAENAYFWKLGWCAVAVERGAMSLGQCMTGEEPKALPTSIARRGAPRPDETQDDPWSREICWATYPDSFDGERSKGRHICGWYATLPPGMGCVKRATAQPFDCLEHVQRSSVAQTQWAMTFTARTLTPGN